jgi:drug/metabolite transporter (DMT)-like permease
MQSQTRQAANHTIIGSLMVLVAAIALSSKAIIVKLAYVYSVDASTLIALRMAFSAPFFIGLAFWAHISPATLKISKHDGWMMALFGALGGYGPMLLDFAGLAYVTAGLERVILFLYPAIVIMFSAILFKHRIGKREWFALVITYIGVALAVGHDLSLAKSGSADTLFGAALVLASSITYAAYLVYSGWAIPRIGSTSFTAYTMLAAAAASGVHYASTSHSASILHLPAQVYWLSLLMAVIATVLPAILLNAGIHRIGSNKSSLVSSIGPVSTILLAYVFLGEHITWLQLSGTGLVLIGVLAISMARK